MVKPVLEQLEAGTFEIFVPESFAAIAEQKARDSGAFLEGSIAWIPLAGGRRGLKPTGKDRQEPARTGKGRAPVGAGPGGAR